MTFLNLKFTAVFNASIALIFFGLFTGKTLASALFSMATHPLAQKILSKLCTNYLLLKASTYLENIVFN